eukprot:15479391-Alexandrium_andersonii.AAC.1
MLLINIYGWTGGMGDVMARRCTDEAIAAAMEECTRWPALPFMLARDLNAEPEALPRLWRILEDG